MSKLLRGGVEAAGSPRRRTAASRNPIAEPTPAPGGTSTSATPSLSIRRPACSGAAPRTRPSSSRSGPCRSRRRECEPRWPCSRRRSRRPRPRLRWGRVRAGRPLRCATRPRPAAAPIKPVSTEGIGLQAAQADIGVGDGGRGAAAVVASRSGVRAGAVWPDGDTPEQVHGRDGAAARADFDHLDGRHRYRHAAALLEAGGAGQSRRSWPCAASSHRSTRSLRWCRPYRTTRSDRDDGLGARCAAKIAPPAALIRRAAPGTPPLAALLMSPPRSASATAGRSRRARADAIRGAAGRRRSAAARRRWRTPC